LANTTNAELIVNIPLRHQVAGGARARVSASLLFLVDGAGFGTWAALLASLQRRLGLDEMQLSFALGALVVGALLGMPLAGWANERFGSHRVLRVIAPAFCVAVVGPAFAPTYGFVVLLALVFGALKGSLDVSVNAQGLVVQTAVGRPILSSLHASWSLGGLGLAALAAAALQRGFGAAQVTALVALVLLLVTTYASRGLLDSRSLEAPPARKAVDPIAIRLGGLAFLALFSEGVLMDWSAVFASRVLAVPEAVAPIAYGTFCGTMAVGRLFGDQVIAALGSRRVLRLGAALTVLGVTLIASSLSWSVDLLGTALAGLGLANLVPVLLGATNRVGAASGRAIATVSSIGYLGFLVGPPVVGGIGHAVGLPAAFLLVAALALLLLLIGPTLLGPAPSDSRRSATANALPQARKEATPW